MEVERKKLSRQNNAPHHSKSVSYYTGQKVDGGRNISYKRAPYFEADRQLISLKECGEIDSIKQTILGLKDCWEQPISLFNKFQEHLTIVAAFLVATIGRL